MNAAHSCLSRFGWVMLACACCMVAHAGSPPSEEADAYMWQAFTQEGDPVFIVNLDAPDSLFAHTCCPLIKDSGHNETYCHGTYTDGTWAHFVWDPHLAPFEMPASEFQPGGTFYAWTVYVGDVAGHWRCTWGEDRCYCTGDPNGNGWYDNDDLLIVLAEWGNPGGPGDVDNSGAVDAFDLILLIGIHGDRACGGP